MVRAQLGSTGARPHQWPITSRIGRTTAPSLRVTSAMRALAWSVREWLSCHENYVTLARVRL